LFPHLCRRDEGPSRVDLNRILGGTMSDARSPQPISEIPQLQQQEHQVED
jgi:hypothetical protein